jgi:DNA-binding beta-propeller fold protein YncE
MKDYYIKACEHGLVVKMQKTLLALFSLPPNPYPLILLIFLLSCSTMSTEDRWNPYSLQWPETHPRIRYHSSLRGEFDVVEIKEPLKKITGEERIPVVLLKPYGVTTDDKGRVYVSDIGRICVFDRQEHRFTVFESPDMPRRPLGMFFDRKDRLLYVADAELNRVFVYSEDGRVFLEIGKNDELLRPGGVVVDSIRDRVYVTNTGRHTISVFNTRGQYIGDIGVRGSGPGQFNFPTQIAIDHDGNIYIVDTGNFRIQVLGPGDGFMNFLSQFGSPGTGLCQFGRPKGIALDRDGNIYITDSLFHGVTIFSRDGKCLLTWGKRGWKPGLFEVPAGIHIDSNGLIYVVSQTNARVDVFEGLGVRD